jgi:hypothetical protein
MEKYLRMLRNEHFSAYDLARAILTEPLPDPSV